MSYHTGPKNSGRTPAEDRTLRQFLNLDGPKGATPEYRRKWVYNFQWTQDRRDEHTRRLAAGASWESAFEALEQERLLNGGF